MKYYRNFSVEQFLKFLMRNIQENIQCIDENNKAYEQVLDTFPVTRERTDLLNSISSQTRSFTNENLYLLKIHQMLMEFYRKYKPELAAFHEREMELYRSVETKLPENREECLGKTISGLIEINHNHPLINDEGFMMELMEKCIESEMYENCAKIKSVLEKL